MLNAEVKRMRGTKENETKKEEYNKKISQLEKIKKQLSNQKQFQEDLKASTTTQGKQKLLANKKKRNNIYKRVNNLLTKQLNTKKRISKMANIETEIKNLKKTNPDIVRNVLTKKQLELKNKFDEYETTQKSKNEKKKKINIKKSKKKNKTKKNKKKKKN